MNRNRYSVRIVVCVAVGAVGCGPPSRADEPVKLSQPTELAKIKLPEKSFARVAWSADGAYLAAGAYVVNVAKKSVVGTLDIDGWPGPLVFSPDGKWIATGTKEQNFGANPKPAELTVFEFPALKAKFTTKAVGKGRSFLDLAWSTDGKTLCAVEGTSFGGREKAEIRRWDMPAFTEKQAIRSPQFGSYSAVAISPDGRTVAVGDEPGGGSNRDVRLFDSATGSERMAFRTDVPILRIDFSRDGKAIGVIGTDKLKWHDAATGRPVEAGAARIEHPPAGFAGGRSLASAAPEGGTFIQASARWPTIVFQRENPEEHGAFLLLTRGGGAKPLRWRIGDANGTGDNPAAAFSPDGKQIAGVVRQGTSELVVIWAVPK